MRILVVDDDYVSRTKLKALLSEYGDCDAAPSGKIGIELFEAAHKEAVPYKLITVDIEMPIMSGLEFIQKVRKWEMETGVRLGAEVKMLAVTVKQDSVTVVASVQQGCEYYLVKPVTPDNLQVALQKMELIEKKKNKASVGNGAT